MVVSEHEIENVYAGALKDKAFNQFRERNITIPYGVSDHKTIAVMYLSWLAGTISARSVLQGETQWPKISTSS